HDRIARPIDAGYPGIVERYGLVERPACGLYDSAFGQVADAVRIHRLSAVDSGDGAYDAAPARFAVDFHLDRDSAIGGQRFVTRKAEASPPAVRQGFRRPAEALGGELDHIARPRVLKMPQPELHRIGARGLCEFIHEAFDGEDVRVGAKRPQGGDPQRHLGHEVPEHLFVGNGVGWVRIAVAIARLADV